MMSVYTLVILLSAWLGGWIGARMLARFAKQIGFDAQYAQAAITLSMLAFLTVVSVSAGALIAAIVAALAGFVTRSPWVPLLVVIALATVGVWESPGTWPEAVPEIGFLLLAAVVFALSVGAARTAALALPVLGGVTGAACLPLLIAPFVFSAAHTSLALDAAIILAALAGGIVVLSRTVEAAAFVRMPLAVLMAYGAIQAMHYGAWPLGIVSLLIWLAGLKLAPRAAQAVP